MPRMTKMTDPADLDAAIAAGEALSLAGREDDAIAHFRDLVERHPVEPRAHFALAGAYDYAGREAEAIAPYRRAMALGLSGDDVARWYVQFGSTLRNVGAHAEAVAVLTEGRARFPDDAAIRAFLALAHHSAGDGTAALVALVDLLSREGAAGRIDLRGYGRALAAYTEALRPT
jgi:Flp pilus assembly protein TadD